MKPDLMDRALDKELAKSTNWKAKDGSEFIIETDYDTLLWVAKHDKKYGNRILPFQELISISLMLTIELYQ